MSTVHTTTSLPAPTAEQVAALSALVCERALSPEQLGTVSALLDFVGRSVCADHRAAEEFPEVWGVRKSRRKSLVVTAELAGMSKSQLDRIERGEVALDRLSDIVALADALQIAPSELMRLPVPAPANGHTDSMTEEVRLALMAVNHRRPGGQVVPIEVARETAVS